MAYSWRNADVGRMRTAAIALAAILATAASADAVELPHGPGGPGGPGFHLPPPAPGPFRAGPPPPDPRAYPPDLGPPRFRPPGPGWPPLGRICLNQFEARDAVLVHRLVDPMQALRAGRLQGEALSARLCRWPPNEFVYEVHVLRRDGRVLRFFMDARSGEALVGPGPH